MTDMRKTTHQATILVIEDEEMLCDLLQEELSALGYKVYVALNGLDGLNRLQEIEPNVIICDRSMPAMTGYQLLERIPRRLPPVQACAFYLPDGDDRYTG